MAEIPADKPCAEKGRYPCGQRDRRPPGYHGLALSALLPDQSGDYPDDAGQDKAEQIFLGEDSALVPLQLRRDQYLINPKISNFNVYFVGYDFDLVYADISE